jgi:flagellin
MITVQTNLPSLQAKENLRVNGEFQSRTIQRLTSGYRITQSGDDAAGLVVANGYRSSVAELTQGVRNANDGVSTLQIIDGGLNDMTKILDRLKTLATESATDTFSGDRAILDSEYQDLKNELTRQSNNIGLGDTTSTWAKSNSVYIGGGTGADNAVTIDLTGVDLSSSGLSLSTDIGTDAATSQTAVTEINAALKTVGDAQGKVGSGQNKLSYAIELAQSQISSYSAAESRIRDADMAAEAANLTKAQVLQQASVAAMAQANSAPQAILSLLRG